MISQLDFMKLGKRLDKTRAVLRLRGRYLETMEAFLVTEVQSERERLAKAADERARKTREEMDAGKSIGMRRSTIFSTTEFGVYEWEVVDEFAFILRNTFFVNLYGFWESELYPLCVFLENCSESVSQLRDVKEFKPEHAKPFLREIGFPLGAETWNKIDGYRVIRNCISHHNGQIDRMSDRDQRRIQEFVRSDFLKDWGDEDLIGLDSYHFSSKRGAREILLRKGSCEQALGVVTRYFDELWDVLENWYVRQRAHPRSA